MTKEEGNRQEYRREGMKLNIRSSSSPNQLLFSEVFDASQKNGV